MSVEKHYQSMLAKKLRLTSIGKNIDEYESKIILIDVSQKFTFNRLRFRLFSHKYFKI